MKHAAAVVLLVNIALLTGCQRTETKQGGYRGTGMQQNIDPGRDSVKAALNVVPESSDPAPVGLPLANTVYQNVQVLKDLNIAQFTRVMLAMAQWVAPPEQACNYCHAANMASDERYTKRVARRMLQMVRHLNTDWKQHVGNTGVVCYTCHRGNAVPRYEWFINPGTASESGFTASNAGKNRPSPSVGLSALPYDPFTRFLLHDENIRVVSTTALPDGNRSSIKQAGGTYGLMLHITQSLGVNCTYCHNTRSLTSWELSTPKRVTAWYGIRMVRDLNNNYLVPLTSTFPEHRLGVLGDVSKINCMTCHQGVFKPLYGVSMAKDYPELQGPLAPYVEAEAPAAAAPAAPATTSAPALNPPPPTALLLPSH